MTPTSKARQYVLAKRQKRTEKLWRLIVAAVVFGVAFGAMLGLAAGRW